MKTYLYLSTAIISVSLATSGNAWAQCVSTQDCTALGYTETSCPNGKGVKCPFGNKWFCGGDNTTICKQEGFTNACTGAGQLGKGESCANLYKQCDCQSTYKYACSGTGYSGGSGSACNGKYTACKCSSGYNWNAASGACIPDVAVCEVGTLYYSDNTCSADYDSSKTLLGIVIYSNGASGGGWVMAHKPVDTDILWSTERVDISGLTNITSESSLTDIQASCTNTDIITAYGDSSTYPAAWAAKNYSPSGTPSGKSWCLPSGGLLKNALGNSANFTKFNNAIKTIQASAGASAATILGKVSDEEYVWSSSEYSKYDAWYFHANTSGSFYMYYNYKDRNHSNDVVRPVLAF